MPSHEMNDNGDCPNIDWASITSTITYSGLDDLPEPVRNFYLVGQLIANSGVCLLHEMNLLTGYLNSLDDASYWAIPEVCDPGFLEVAQDLFSPSVDRCLLWMEVLAAKWPLPASIFTKASLCMLLEEGIWREVFFRCSRCMNTPGWSKDKLRALLGFGGPYLMVDGFQGEHPENDLLTALEKIKIG